MNDKKNKCFKKNKNLKNSIIYFTLSAHYSKKLINQTLRVYRKIASHIHRVRVYENSALSYYYLAGGRLDGKISVRTDPFSSGAGVLITQEAGGKVTDLSGKLWDINKKFLAFHFSLFFYFLFLLFINFFKKLIHKLPRYFIGKRPKFYFFSTSQN